MKVIVSAKGQVTIPKKLRDRMGIRPGQVLDFGEERGRLVALKANLEDPLEKVCGILKLGRSTDEITVELRGEPDAGVIRAIERLLFAPADLRSRKGNNLASCF